MTESSQSTCLLGDSDRKAGSLRMSVTKVNLDREAEAIISLFQFEYRKNSMLGIKPCLLLAYNQ